MKRVMLLLAAIVPADACCSADKWALVIGNGAYEEGPLRCPVNDATDVAKTLEDLGFKVTKLTNANQQQMENAIRHFGQHTKQNDVALFYFSGHGAQVKGVNYLIPVGIEVNGEDEMKYKCVAAEMVLDKLQRAGSTVNIIILDACRSNPFKRFKNRMHEGLSQMNSPAGTIIAYATAPGTVALDGDKRNSPYTKYLIENMKKPRLKIEDVFKRVRVSVMSQTKKRQIPWESSSLTGDFAFADWNANSDEAVRVDPDNKTDRKSPATASLAPAANDFFPGDVVAVAKDNVELGLKDKMAVVLSTGDKLHVTEVRGVWIGGYSTVGGKRHTGWVHRTEIKLMEPSPENVAVIEVPDKPDDAEAVAALRELGVELELNEKGNVHSADCTESEVTDKDLKNLTGLHQIAVLELSGRPITDEGAKSLAGLSVLQELYLENAEVTDQSLAIIKSLRNLEVLAMPKTKVTGPGLVHLVALSNLRVLNFTACEIGDDALKPLEKMPHVEVLAIPRTKVTSSGLVHMRPIVKLRVLNLTGCDVDDAGLEHLKGLDNLRMLYVRETKVTEDATAAFKDDAPSLAIYD